MTKVGLKTAYLDDEAVIRKGKYGDGSIALVAQDPETGEQLTKLTVSMIAYGEVPRENHVFIKDYGENEGVYDALLAAGVVEPRIRTLTAGFAVDGVSECKLTDADAIGEL